MAGAGGVRVGLIGVGRFARTAHFPALESYPAARVTAVCDPNPEALARAAGRFQVEEAARYAAAGDLIASGRVDAVIVSTPNALHYAQAKAALERGLHVLVDKPLVLHTREAVALRALAEQRGRVLMVGYNRHYDPASRYLRGQIRSGALGEVRLVRTLQRGLTLVDVPWYHDAALSGGRMLTLRATHMVDLVRWLTGSEVESVSATIRWRDEARGLDGDSVALLRLANGALAEVTCLEDDADRNLDEVHVYGSAGTLAIARPPGVAMAWRPAPPFAGEETWPAPALPDGDSVTRNFLDVVRGVAENGSPATDGVAAVRAIEAIFESARSARPVRLWPDGGP